MWNSAGGPLLFNSHQHKNAWQDNLFLKDGTLSSDFVEVMQACAGLEQAYRKSILKQEANPCQYSVLSDLGIDERTRKNYLAALGGLPILSGHAVLPLVELGLPVVDGRTAMTGRNLLDTGLALKLGKPSQVVWIAYQVVK